MTMAGHISREKSLESTEDWRTTLYPKKSSYKNVDLDPPLSTPHHKYHRYTMIWVPDLIGDMMGRNESRNVAIA